MVSLLERYHLVNTTLTQSRNQKEEKEKENDKNKYSDDEVQELTDLLEEQTWAQ